MKGLKMANVVRRELRVCVLMLVMLLIASVCVAEKNDAKLASKARDAMKEAAAYMVDDVSTNGGYLWYYYPDMSRRWGEMEAYETMIWVQPPGSTSMGHLFLDAYHVTGDPYYYEAAKKVASALIWGQLNCGGWNYIVDFAGDRSLKRWYDTIGKNGWRLEEFQHYYGNATFDDDVSSDAARFLLRMYLEELDPVYKQPLEKAINFILESQYPIGGWPQRYPLKYDFSHHGNPDYSSFYTFNDDVVAENVNFLIQCYETLGEKRFLDPIYRGMNFYIVTQQGEPQAGWAQQYSLDLKPAGARTYEPLSLDPGQTVSNIYHLMRFYRLTGDSKFLSGIPAALDWLDSCRLPADMTDGGKYTHSIFIEIGTNRSLFVHRRGSNVKHGYYWADYDDNLKNVHYGWKRFIDVDKIRSQYEELKAMDVDEVTKDSPLLPGTFDVSGATPQDYYKDSFSSIRNTKVPTAQEVRGVLEAMDQGKRWLTTGGYASNPYIGDGVNADPTEEFASTNVGDETDTSPYTDESGQQFISTSVFIRNMQVLMNYIGTGEKD